MPRSLADRFRLLDLPEVADVAVLRGAASTEHAQGLAARAFTHAGTVFLPGDAEPAANESLLAHELTHAVQQRGLGHAIPAEHSAEGQRLEADALAVEAWVAGYRPEPPTLRYPDSAQPVAGEEHTVTVRWPEDLRSGTQRAELAPTPTPADGVAKGLAGALVAARNGLQTGADGLDARPSDQAGIDGPTDEATARFLAGEVARILGNDPPRRWVDLDSFHDLEEIAKRLYDRLHRRLRFDLLVERERNGSLMDFR